jgi:hypothetical protein
MLARAVVIADVHQALASGSRTKAHWTAFPSAAALSAQQNLTAWIAVRRQRVWVLLARSRKSPDVHQALMQVKRTKNAQRHRQLLVTV